MEHKPVKQFGVWAGLTPISINAAYANGPHGRRFLTAAGKKFKDTLVRAIVAAIDPVLVSEIESIILNDQGWVELEIHIDFEDYRVKSWKPGKMPWRQKDTSNYIKLIEDAVVTATGIDDCAHKSVKATKRDAKTEVGGRVGIYIKYLVYKNA